jgi:PAS domain S-box-containing protein
MKATPQSPAVVQDGSADAQFRMLVEHAPDGIFIADAQGHYLEVNAAGCEMLGYSREEILGLSITDVVAPDEIPRVADEVARLRGGCAVKSEWRFHRKDGSTFHGEVHGRQLTDSRLLGYVRDVSESRQAEDKLRASQKFIEAVANASPPMIYVFDLDQRRLMYLNRPILAELGYPDEAAAIDRLDAFTAFMPTEEESHLERVLREWRHLADGAVREDEYQLRDATGAIHWFLARETAFTRGADGAVSQILGTLYDITQRKHIEELLRRSEERYRLIVENQTEFVVKWRPDGTRTFVNDSYCRTFGVREEECVGTSFFPLVAPDYREAIRRQTAALTPAAREFTEEHESLLPGGRRWQQWNSRGIFDAAGRLVEILSTGRDISERKEAEEKLRQNRMHLLASQHIARVGSWEMDLVSHDDLADNPLRWSDECYRIFAFEPGEVEVTARTFFDRVHPDDRDRVRSAARLAVRERSLYSIDHRILLVTGEERILHEQAELVLDAATGTPVKFIGTTQDITDRVKLEEQLRQSQKMQAIGQLAGGVAHDFNNLLTVINGHAEIALDRLAAGDPLRAELTPIRDAGQRAALLTRQLLLFSRKAVLEPQVLDCGDLVRRTSQMLRRLITEEIDISVVLPPSSARVRGDPTQIEQVIINLSLNACDAMPRGGRLTIETRNTFCDAEFCREHPECAPGGYVQIVVSDTGCGMTPYVKAHLFEPFFTTKGPGRGTGLGLATVHGIVQESGGFVTVSSEVNVGTTFSVFLPALDSTDAQTATEPVDHARLRGRETVLVVEDDPEVRAVTTRTLAKYGYHVLEASDGPAALRISNDTAAIDLLLSDVVIPEMSGRQVADAILISRPQCRVLFMSGYNEEMLADRAATGPADAFIQKPFSPVALATKVRELLDRRGPIVPPASAET